MFKEVENFYNSLPFEEKHWGERPRAIVGADFVTGVRGIDGMLIGIGGVYKAYGLAPTLFVMVRSQFQGKGFGEEIMTNVLSFVRKNYNFLMLSVGKGENRIAARHLYRKHGFKPFYEEENRYWVYISFNRRGKIICKFLPLIYLILRCINLLPLARVLVSIDRYILKRQHKRNTRGDRATTHKSTYNRWQS